MKEHEDIFLTVLWTKNMWQIFVLSAAVVSSARHWLRCGLFPNCLWQQWADKMQQ